MNVECPYCSQTIDVVHLERHVRMRDDSGHGAHGSVPMDGLDNPWHLRLDTSDPPDEAGAVGPSVQHVVDETSRGRCPACDMGVLGFKGGDGFLSSGRQRLACPNCGWESPEWIELRE